MGVDQGYGTLRPFDLPEGGAFLTGEVGKGSSSLALLKEGSTVWYSFCPTAPVVMMGRRRGGANELRRRRVQTVERRMIRQHSPASCRASLRKTS